MHRRLLRHTDWRRPESCSQAAPAVAVLMAYLQSLLSVGGLQQQVLVGLAVHAELVPRLWFSYLRVRLLLPVVAMYAGSAHAHAAWPQRQDSQCCS